MRTSAENAAVEVSRLVGFESSKLLGEVESSGFDVEDFFSICEDNGILIIADDRIRFLPMSIRESWQSRFGEKIRHYREFFAAREQHLKNILKSAARENVEIILLKGSAVGATLAPHFSYKKMNDIDVLVRREDGPRFISVIKDLGFLSVGNLFSQDDFSEKSHHTPPYYSSDMSCLLGIHWELCSPYARWKTDTSEIWRCKQELNVMGERAWRMSWEHNLLHMCFHLPLFKTGLRELQDLAAIVEVNTKVPQLDWAEVFRLAREWRVEEPVFRVLSLTYEILKPETPRPDLIDLKPAVSLWIARETELRKKYLLRSRSTFVAKIEKAYSVSVLSKDPAERLKAWAATWIWTFFPPRKERAHIALAHSSGGQRLFAPLYIMRAMAQDYGLQLFVIITAVNVGRAMKSLIQALLLVRGEKILQSEQYKILKALE